MIDSKLRLELKHELIKVNITGIYQPEDSLGLLNHYSLG